MKNINKIVMASVLGIAVTSSVIAQGRPGGPPAGAGGGVAFLSTAYARIVPFDPLIRNWD
jgi:hypothetical protein